MFPSELDPGKPRSNCQQFQAGRRTETNSRQLAPLTALSSARKSQLVFLYAQVLLELCVAKEHVHYETMMDLAQGAENHTRYLLTDGQ